MVKILKIFGYILFFFFALVFFVEKASVYYFAEKELAKKEVIISNETIEDKLLTLELNNPQLYFKKIEFAKAENIDIGLFLLYNRVKVKNILLSDIAASFLPLAISEAEVTHTVINPMYVDFEANGEFGEAEGEISILDRNITVILKPSDLMLKKYRRGLSQFKKNENGEYVYAKTF